MDTNEKTFGGYLGYAESTGSGSKNEEALFLSTGRACIATALRIMRPVRIHVPHYICGSVLEPIQEQGVEPVFYRLDELLRPSPWPSVGSDEMLLVVNYFGVMEGCSTGELRDLGAKAILDNSQAFFSAPVKGCWNFNSARKFFGVPDGAYLYPPFAIDQPTAQNTAVVTEHLELAAKGRQAEGLPHHRANEALMDTTFQFGSVDSQRLLRSVDMEGARAARASNFMHLHEYIKDLNTFNILEKSPNGPYHYPLILSDAVDLSTFHKAGIFAPCIWPDVLTRNGTPEFERLLVKRLVALPIDQRYNNDDIDDIAERVRSVMHR